MDDVKVKVHLQYGEKDGAKPTIELPALPRMGSIIYTWPTNRDQRIREAQHHEERYKALVSQLSVLAYQHQGEKIEREAGQPTEYLFRRYEKADKTVSDPAV
jgi:hypothetical protein